MQFLDSNLKCTSSMPSFSECTKFKTESTMGLPPVDISTFNGDWQDWMSFIDSYNATFHKYENLAPVQKCRYLKNCLRGQPSDIIRSIPATVKFIFKHITH